MKIFPNITTWLIIKREVFSLKFQKTYIFTILLLSFLIPAFVQANSNGITLFNQEKYSQAICTFTEELKTQPENPVINHYIGRSFLALNMANEAVEYLKKAVILAPDNPDYQFWLGVGYWANMDFDKERQSYIQVLKLDPDHIQANIYLGHNYSDRNQWKAALAQYDRVLAINPAVPDALYNRALVLKKTGRINDEKIAWKLYLDRYRSGKWSFRAADHLNQYGDYSYRIYLLGSRRIVVPSINFEPGSSTLNPEGLSALERIGYILTNKRKLSLYVIAFVKNNPDLAKSRAIKIKKTILEKFPEIDSSRLTTSWLDVSEKKVTENETYILNESINIITKNNGF